MYFRLLIRDGTWGGSRPTTTGVTRLRVEDAAPRSTIRLGLSTDSLVRMTKISSASLKAFLVALIVLSDLADSFAQCVSMPANSNLFARSCTMSISFDDE